MAHVPPRVLLLAVPARVISSPVLAGIRTYEREHGPWEFLAESFTLPATHRHARRWSFDGVIGGVVQLRALAEVRPLDRPVVNITSLITPWQAWATVAADPHRIGQMAAEHLLGLGLASHGYWGAGLPDMQLESFRRTLAQAGHVCHDLHGYHRRLYETVAWRQAERKLLRWLRGLAWPTGIFAFEDLAARMITQACLSHGIRVPQDVAVLGATDDQNLCELSWPTLSAVSLNAHQVGYEAAAMLDRLMRARRRPARTLMRWIEPTGVVQRQSTRRLRGEDDAVQQAMDYALSRLGEPLQAQDMAQAVNLSRSSLERRFRLAMGCSPAQALRQARLEHLRQLLADTHLSMSQLAAACGFHTPEYMATVFRREMGVSPTAYRRQRRTDRP